MAENVVTRYDPHFHLGMRVMTLIWCFRGWQVCSVGNDRSPKASGNFGWRVRSTLYSPVWRVTVVR